MNSYFRRQLTDYVEYHRDPWNCAMHVIGIVFLFLAAVLPLSSWSVAAFGVETSAATIAVVPVLIYWFLLDAALGTAILGADGQSYSPAARTDVCDGEAVHRAWLSARSCRCYPTSSTNSAAQLFAIRRETSGGAAPTRMTRVLVTGGSGFIGQHLVSALVARDRQVRVLDLKPPTCALPEVQYVKGSVLDPGLVDDALDGVDQVYHLAGLPGMWMPRKVDFHTVNYRGTEVVIAAARKRGVARFLHCSTESILFRSSPSDDTVADDALLPAH